MKRKGNQIQFTAYISNRAYRELRKMTKATGIPTAELVRRAIDYIIRKPVRVVDLSHD